MKRLIQRSSLQYNRRPQGSRGYLPLVSLTRPPPSNLSGKNDLTADYESKTCFRRTDRRCFKIGTKSSISRLNLSGVHKAMKTTLYLCTLLRLQALSSILEHNLYSFLSNKRSFSQSLKLTSRAGSLNANKNYIACDLWIFLKMVRCDATRIIVIIHQLMKYPFR